MNDPSLVRILQPLGCLLNEVESRIDIEDAVLPDERREILPGDILHHQDNASRCTRRHRKR